MQNLCFSKNNIEIVYETVNSHVATHFEDAPELKSAVIESLTEIDVIGSSMLFEFNLGRIIGLTDLVVTNDSEDIIFAKRKNRDIYTRFTKSQLPESCSTVTISLNRLSDRTYLLWSAWIGYIGPPFPGDPNETPESKDYWSKHALVWGNQEIQPGTETTVSPW